MSANGNITTSSFKVDFVAASLVGILASIFASISLYNLDFFGKKVLGIEVSLITLFLFFISFCLFGIIVARVLGKKIPLIYKFGKFGEAGGLNWLVDLGIVNLLIIITGFNAGIYFAIYKGVSFIIAAGNSYLWNKFWVFQGAKKQKSINEVGKFAIATTSGMLINVFLASAISLIGPIILADISGNSWANIATVVGSLTAMIYNFIIYKVWVFKS